jgi:hypothetical protein
MGFAREYLYIEQLDGLTPWTREAIGTMVRRGVFKRGVHYFQPGGRRGRLIFKWSRVVEFIEHPVAADPQPVIEVTSSRSAASDDDVRQATEALRRMLR